MAVSKISKDTCIREYGNAPVTISAGTAGTYATMNTQDITIAGYKPVMAAIAKIQHPGQYIPVVANMENKIYFIFYRAVSSAYTIPANDVTVTVLYEKTG
jgi:hypothetical protein